MKSISTLILLSALALSGCETGIDEASKTVGTYDGEYDKPVLGVIPEAGKQDSAAGIGGPPATTSAPHAVWVVQNSWADTDTNEARAAGMAWAENSGLTWDEKYAAWIASLPRIAADGWGETFTITTPYGVSMPAPRLECAEASVFLRTVFASWYGLPFYISAWDGSQRLHFGHFGVYEDNAPDPRFGTYTARYEDYSGSDLSSDEWPTDAKLAKRKISSRGDDQNPWMGEEKYAGAYMDALLLNKRVGHFLMVMLTYTGSMHLASHWNTFNLAPAAVRPGDTLLHRWQRQGIGHTMVVTAVSAVEGFDDKLDVEIVAGSMPRRQPKWQSPASSKMAFTPSKAGGHGEASDGNAYATLGGGLKRWRWAEIHDGRWRNVVPGPDQDSWTDHSDLDAMAGRTDTFETLLGAPTPQEQLETLLDLIQLKRRHLRDFPASCSARIGREEAFGRLYPLMAEHFGLDRAQTDLQYRLIEDYVFAELTYDQSRTCCWNSTNATMFDVIMDRALALTYDEEAQTCATPPVFKMVDGDYAVWREHAVTLGVADRWADWSADESCPQAETVATDTEAGVSWTPFCTVRPFES